MKKLGRAKILADKINMLRQCLLIETSPHRESAKAGFACEIRKCSFCRTLLVEVNNAVFGLRIVDCPALKFQEELLKFEENRFREFGFYAMYQLRWI